MQISVTSNASAVAKAMDGLGRNQFPFAMSMALNDVARQAGSKTLKEKADDVFEGGAVPYTKSGFRYKKSNKRNLTAEVFVERGRADYMRLQIYGGIRTPKDKKILIPTQHTRLNRYGNITRGTYSKIINDRSKYFSGIPKGLSGDQNRGIWERYGRATRSGGQRIRKVANFRDRANYQALFPFRKTVEGVVFARRTGFADRFQVRLKEALRNKKR